MAYGDRPHLGGLQAALTGMGAFAEAFKGWDQVARQNIQLAEAQKLARIAENLQFAGLPQELDIGGADPTGSGTPTKRRSPGGAGAVATPGVTLGEAFAALKADNVAKEQEMLGAEEQLAAAQRAEREALALRAAGAEAQRIGARLAPELAGRDEALARVAAGKAEQARVEAASMRPSPEEVANYAAGEAKLRQLAESLGTSDEGLTGLRDSLSIQGQQVPRRDQGLPHELAGPADGIPPQLLAAAKAFRAGPTEEVVAVSDTEADQSVRPTRRVPGSGGPGDTGLGTWVAINEEEAVDAAAVAGGTAAVAAELGGETAEAGTLVENLNLDPSRTIDEIKREINQLAREGVVRNPLAVFSGVIEDSDLPSIEKLSFAIGMAKDGHRKKLGKMLGRKVSRSEVKKLDKLMADYRGYAKGLTMKADEIREEKRDIALEKEQAKGDNFAMLVVGDLAKLKSPEDAELLADHLGDMYVYDPAGARALLTFWRGMKKDELAEEAARLRASNVEARARAKSAVGGKGAKQAMVDYFKELSQASDAAKKSDEAQKNIDSQTLTNQQTADWVKKKAIYDRQVAYHRDRAEKARAKSQGIDFSTRIALISGFTGDFDKKHREKFDKAKDKEAAWATYEDRVASMLASTYGGSGGTYLGIEEDVASIMKSLRAHYVAPAATTVDETKPTPDDAKVYQKPLTEEARGTMGPKGAAAFEKQRVTYLSTLIEKKEAEVAKVPILRNRLAIAQSNEDLRGALKIKDELNSLRKRLSGLAKQYEEITDSKPEGFVEPVDELLRDIGSMVKKYQERQTPGFGYGQRRPSGGVGGGRSY